MSFASFQLNPAILQALEELGYSQPTPIQEQAIPEVLAGKDLLASAQTGTGKTAAFILPALHQLAGGAAKARRGGPRMLVLVPTRELAMQVATAAKKYSKHLKGINTVCIYGGMPFFQQNKELSRPYDILVATPGRLLDHLERRRIDLSSLQLLVLDEADRMLDMGFIDDVEKICAATPAERQTLLFSATFDKSILKLAHDLQREPVTLHVKPASEALDQIEQRLYYADNLDHKMKLLEQLLEGEDMDQAILFTATKQWADKLADHLSEQGHCCEALHGDMNQRQRSRTLERLRRGQVKYLVATDVAARGIDVKGITHVVNFDLPNNVDDYVHRIGRTGRAGAKGIALSLVLAREASFVSKIEKRTGALSILTIAGLEPQQRPRRGPAPYGGGRPRRPAPAYGTRHGAPSFGPRRPFQGGHPDRVRRPQAGASRAKWSGDR